MGILLGYGKMEGYEKHLSNVETLIRSSDDKLVV